MITKGNRAWAVRVEYAHRSPIRPEQHVEALGQLANLHASGTLARDGLRGSIRVTLNAEGPMEALHEATTAVHNTLTEVSAGVDIEISGIEAQAEEAFLADLTQPNYPPMVGQSEIADMLRISPQRVQRIIERDNTFPTPAITTRSCKLWPTHIIEAWIEQYNARPQRVRRYTAKKI